MLALLFYVTLAFPKCLTETDLKNEACRVLCIRDGYSSGKSFKKGCACYDVKENTEDFAARRINLGPKTIPLEGDNRTYIRVENADE